MWHIFTRDANYFKIPFFYDHPLAYVCMYISGMCEPGVTDYMVALVIFTILMTRKRDVGKSSDRMLPIIGLRKSISISTPFV